MAKRELIGMTLHFSDKTFEKVPVSALINWKKSGGGNSGGGQQQRYRWIDADECPKHGRWDVIPAGYSKKTESDYDSFYSCVKGCNNRPGRDWTDDNDADEYAEQTAETANDDSADDFDANENLDDLPF
jgi:hypothetical protein